jgi:hypothetical protein
VGLFFTPSAQAPATQWRSAWAAPRPLFCQPAIECGPGPLRVAPCSHAQAGPTPRGATSRRPGVGADAPLWQHPGCQWRLSRLVRVRVRVQVTAGPAALLSATVAGQPEGQVRFKFVAAAARSKFRTIMMTPSSVVTSSTKGLKVDQSYFNPGDLDSDSGHWWHEGHWHTQWQAL